MSLWKSLKTVFGRFVGKPQRGQWHDGQCKFFELNTVSQHFVEAYEQGLLKPGDRCLDVGCGEGHSSAWMAEKGLQVLGIDLIPAAIEKARTRYGSRDNLEFRQADATQTLSNLGQFDAILDRGCLHTIPLEFWPAYFQNIATCLKSNGVFLLQGRIHKRLPKLFHESLLQNLPQDFEVVQATPIDMFENQHSQPRPGVQYLIRRHLNSSSRAQFGG